MKDCPALDWLYSTQSFGIKLGLEPTHRLLRELGVDTGDMTVFHIAGTNGKGSTCAFLESVCRVAGYRTGLFTSPHLVSFRERIRVNGVPVADGILEAGLLHIRKLVEDWDPHPTFFEIVTGLGLRCFQDAGVEIAVVETGMGGRLDSTNAVSPDVAVITPIGLDHQKWLGDTLAEIAGEKAGIIKPGIPVVTGWQAPEAAAVIKARAAKLGSALSVVDQPVPPDWTLGLMGEHQRANAALALEALNVAGLNLPEAVMRQGLASTCWPGRFQIVIQDGVTIVIDGAHNPAGCETLVHTWRQQFGETLAAVVYGSVRDKDPAESLAILHPITGELFLTTTPTGRGIEAEELVQYTRGQSIHMAPDPADALQAAKQSGLPVLVCGSLYLVGKALEILGWSDERFQPSLQ